MAIRHNGHEHEFEPQHGLPERLPADERILWQGSPDAASLARSAFHLRKLVLYFGLIMVWQAATLAGEGGDAGALLLGMVWPLALAGIGLGAVALLAYLTARTAVYTLTDRRVVMRIGIVLTLTFNLPLKAIASASLRRGPPGHGDIVLSLAGTDRIAYLHLWPHARPWRISRPEPMLRAIPQAEQVAAQLSRAWAAATGQGTAAQVPAPAGREPERQQLQPSLG